MPVDSDLVVGSVDIEFQIGSAPRPLPAFDAVLYETDVIREFDATEDPIVH